MSKLFRLVEPFAVRATLLDAEAKRCAPIICSALLFNRTTQHRRLRRHRTHRLVSFVGLSVTAFNFFQMPFFTKRKLRFHGLESSVCTTLTIIRKIFISLSNPRGELRYLHSLPKINPQYAHHAH